MGASPSRPLPAANWRGVTATEKAASQEHFIDLCRMLGEPTPHEADPTGTHYAFEKGASDCAGGERFADVWKRERFGWEYDEAALAFYRDVLGMAELAACSPSRRWAGRGVRHKAVRRWLHWNDSRRQRPMLVEAAHARPFCGRVQRPHGS